MKIGIIGGGAAGLITAWLLEEHHEVTLFEKEPRFGGHCETVAVELKGRTWHVDLGIHFFSDRLQPTFMKLLKYLDAPYRAYEPSSTFHNQLNGWTVCLPPFGNASRMTGLAKPKTLSTLLAFKKLIAESIDLVEQEGDFSITLEQFVGNIKLPPRFPEDFVYPYLCSYWGVSQEEVRHYSARNVLSYLVLLRPPVMRPVPVYEMTGGMKAYIDLLVPQLTRAELLSGTAIEGIQYTEGKYQVHAASGVHMFDRLVFATNAAQAHNLLVGLPGTERQREALAGVRYFESRMAAHGDTRFMPPNRRHWSTVNGMFDGTYCATTDWADGNRDVDLFRSWITHAPFTPDPLYAEVTYQHPHPDVSYFHTQTQLKALQGQGNLWFTGMHVTHYDNHEGAVRSARDVALALAPDTRRLRLLQE